MTREHRALGAVLGLSAVLVMVAVSIAATADLHPGGYDGECGLCQFHKTALELPAFLPLPDPSGLALPDSVLPLEVGPFQSRFAIARPCRAPPQ